MRLSTFKSLHEREKNGSQIHKSLGADSEVKHEIKMPHINRFLVKALSAVSRELLRSDFDSSSPIFNYTTDWLSISLSLLFNMCDCGYPKIWICLLELLNHLHPVNISYDMIRGCRMKLNFVSS